MRFQYRDHRRSTRLRPARTPSSHPPAAIERLETRTLFNNTIYYISPTGSDSNSGRSPTDPWQTINMVDGGSFLPGDKILFQGGATFNGSIIMAPDDVGTAASPITIGSYGPGGGAFIFSGDNGVSDGVLIFDTGYINITNLHIAGGGIGVNIGSGIDCVNNLPGTVKKSHVYVDSVDVFGFGVAGVTLNGTTAGSGFDDVRITNASLHDNQDAGFFSFAGDYTANPAPFGYAHSHVYLAHVYAFNNPGQSGTNASGNGIQMGNVDGATIERCVTYNNGTANVSTGGGPVGIWCFNSNGVVVQYNESHNNTAAHKDGGGFDIDGGSTNCILQYNYSHDNAGAGYLFAEFPGAHPFTNNVIRYNISQNDGRNNGYPAIEIGSANFATPFTNCEIFGNTVYTTKPTSGSSTAGLSIKGPTLNLHVRNNIFYTTGNTISIFVSTAGTGLLFQGNDYWTGSATAINLHWLGKTYNTIADWRNATGQEKVGSRSVGMTVAPGLISPGGGIALNNADKLTTITAYKLLSNSPLIDTGVDLQSLGVSIGTHDYYGDALPQGNGFDIGVHELVPSAPTHTFTSSDIGSPSPSGKTTVVTAGKAYDISAAGTMIGGTSDQFRFAYTSLTGNFDVKVRIAAFTATDAWAKAGLMMRSSLAANSADFLAFAQASSGLDGVLSRTKPGANAVQTTAGSPKYPNAWLRIRRVGNTLTAFYGTNGTTWTQLGSAVTFSDLGSTVYVGMAINSRVNGKLATAQFRDLTVA